MGALGARILIESSLGGTPYVARALELLDIAERGISSESCVVWSEHGGVVHTVALVGLMAALNGGGQIHLLLGDDRHIVGESEIGDMQFYVAPPRRVVASLGYRF